MDAELGSQLGPLLHHGDHVLHAAHALAHVPVIGVAGVMALAGVALEQDQLAQPVGVQGHPLDVVQRHQEGVLGVSAEVHADAQVHRVPHQLAVDGDVHDGAAVGDGTVLPVHFAVAVLVLVGEHHLGEQGQLGGFMDQLVGGDGVKLPLAQGGIRAGLFVYVGVVHGKAADLAVIVPQGAAQADRLGPAVLAGGEHRPHRVVVAAGQTAVGGVLGVAGQTDADPAVAEEAGEEIHRLALAHLVVGENGLVAGGHGGIAGHAPGDGHGLVLAVGGHGDQAVVGDLNGLQGMFHPVVLQVVHLVDVERQGVVPVAARHDPGGDFDVQPGVHGLFLFDDLIVLIPHGLAVTVHLGYQGRPRRVPGVLVHGHGVGDGLAVGAFGAGDNRLYGHAVEHDNVQRVRLAVHRCLLVRAGVQHVPHNTGERLVHVHLHGAGGQLRKSLLAELRQDPGRSGIRFRRERLERQERQCHHQAQKRRQPTFSGFSHKIPFPFLFGPSRSAGRVFAPAGTEGRTEKSPFRPVRIPYGYFFGNLLISQFSKVDFGRNDEICQKSFVFFAKSDVSICPRAVMSGVGPIGGRTARSSFP